MLKQLGETSRAFRVTTTEDVSAFTAENLRHYAAVMFFTTGELPMSDAQKAALLAFVRSGRGFLGVHSATDTFYKWPDYRKLVGGYFNEHPWHQKVTVDVADPANPLVGFLAPSFAINDEIYQIRDFDAQTSRILLRLDPASVDLDAPNVHRQDYGWPLAWTRSYRPRPRVLYGARPRGGGVARPALSADADERHLVDDAPDALTCVGWVERKRNPSGP